MCACATTQSSCGSCASLAQLRKRYRAIASDLQRLDDELHQIAPQDGDDPRRLRPGSWRILLAVDNSEPSARAVNAAAAIAQVCAGEVMVFHLREVERMPKGPAFESQKEAKELVAAIVERLRGEGLSAEGAVCATRPGQVARGIADRARQMGADLIILGVSRPLRTDLPADRQRRSPDDPARRAVPYWSFARGFRGRPRGSGVEQGVETGREQTTP